MAADKIEDLLHEFHSIVAYTTHLHQQYETLQSEFNSLQQQNKDLLQKSTASNKHVEDLKSEKQILEDACTKLRSEITSLTDQLTHERRLNAKYQLKDAQSQQQNKKAKQ